MRANLMVFCFKTLEEIMGENLRQELEVNLYVRINYKLDNE